MQANTAASRRKGNCSDIARSLRKRHGSSDNTMNIIVKTYGREAYYCRPDTTWERENKDLFAPDAVGGYLYAPVLFARICKAGKCVGRKFAGRYYDSIGYGLLLYIADFLDGTQSALARASASDHTSFLPFPMFNRVTLESGENVFRLYAGEKMIFSTSEGSAELIEDALTGASELISLRIGDFIAVELAAAESLICRKDGEVAIKGRFCENDVFDFRIIM